MEYQPTILDACVYWGLVLGIGTCIAAANDNPSYGPWALILLGALCMFDANASRMRRWFGATDTQGPIDKYRDPGSFRAQVIIEILLAVALWGAGIYLLTGQ
jgi:hypothetical protein